MIEELFSILECRSTCLEGLRKTRTVHVRFEVFTAVTIKEVVFWDEALCRCWVNRRFGRAYSLHFQGGKNSNSEATGSMLAE
jgi:hypothetical protein